VSDQLTFEDVLDIDYPGEPAWGPAGRFVAAPVYEDDGQALLFATVDGERWRFCPDDEFVTAFAWADSPDQPAAAVTTDAGALLLVDPETHKTSRLLSDPAGITGITWSNAGDRIACYRDGRPTVVDVDGATVGLDAPDRGPFLGEGRPFAWRDDDELLAYRFADGDAKDVGVVALEDGALVWRTEGPESNHSPAWLGDRLLYDQQAETGTVRRFMLTALDGASEVLFEERDADHGTISRGTPQPSPDGSRVAAALPLDGWEHVHVFDADGGHRQLTEGAFEDKGLASSSPQWIDDRTLAFASNRRDLGQRQLFAVDTDGETWPLVESPGTNVHPRPSPDGSHLAYVHADRTRSPELRVCELRDSEADADDASRRLTRAVTEEWPVEPIAPRELTVESVGGLDVHAYLLDPRESDAVDDDGPFPGVVYVHGGPMRQMRDGFHPARSYGLAYAVMQYFATQGYAGLLVNYRGGVGYGAAFQRALAPRGRDEMEDIAILTEAFAECDFVDGERVGVWGLSYGGYATLQMLGTHDCFAVGVNLAGLADVELYREWAHETKFPAVASATPVRMGGYPHEARENWEYASPVTHFEAYDAPLYSFHGTDDDYVNVAQLDLVVDRLLDLDADFEAEYYPDENHVFARRAVWERTLTKIEDAFERHLTGTARP